jgi:acyl-coenzyme A synthetase/AMP-(fatty) acid ligase
MDWSAASTFRLIEDQSIQNLSELETQLCSILASVPLEAGLVVYPNSVRSVVLGLLAAARGRNVFLVRDPSAPPPHETISLSQEPFAWFRRNEQQAVPALWMQTSGTTGRPKWVEHPMTALLDGLKSGDSASAVWLLTYAASSFAGVQVILSALLGGHCLVCRASSDSLHTLVDLVARHAVTHASGTPTFWRGFLRLAGQRPSPFRHITLGGETADAPTLQLLAQRYPQARIRHIYATTETGVVFTVSDGLPGFPAAWLGKELPTGLSASLSSNRTLLVHRPGANKDCLSSYIDTGDVIELKAGRALFRGRVDSLINIGGLKVFPEDVEAHILSLPEVSDVRISAQPSPITGCILTADVVPVDAHVSQDYLVRLLRQHLTGLPRHARPALIRVKNCLPIGSTSKKSRTA